MLVNVKDPQRLTKGLRLPLVFRLLARIAVRRSGGEATQLASPSVEVVRLGRVVSDMQGCDYEVQDTESKRRRPAQGGSSAAQSLGASLDVMNNSIYWIGGASKFDIHQYPDRLRITNENLDVAWQNVSRH